MQVLFGPYPMRIAQLAAWATDEAGKLTVRECAKALHVLDQPRAITIRRA
jgi:hypothetical protein